MGMHKNISFDNFPSQNFVGRKVLISFNYDEKEKPLSGVVVRCDAEAPGITIIKLADGRHVLGTECIVEEVDPRFTNERIRYDLKDIKLEAGHKHIIVGAISGRDHIDLNDWHSNIVKEGELITEEMFEKMIRQNRDIVTVREVVFVPLSEPVR